MRIATQLRIISSATIIMLVVMIPLLIVSLTEFKSAKNDSVLAESISHNFFERASFRDQYFLYREDRVKDLWDANKRIADTLMRQASVQLQGEENRQLLAQLNRYIEETAQIFHRIVSNTEVLKTAGANAPVYQELDKRLSSQLLLKAAGVRNSITALQELAAERVEQTYSHLIIIIASFALTLTFTTLLVSGYLGKVIRKRLISLHAGVEVVASGNLDFRIENGGTDEFAELARSFNGMTVKLEVLTERLEQKVAERTAALSESKEYLAITLNSIGDGVIVTDAAGQITQMNPTAERLSGWSLADATGLPLADVFRIVNATTRETVPDPVHLVMAHGQVVGLANHTVLLARDGQEYQIADSAAPIRNAADEIMGVVLVFSDVTEKYQIEKALLDSEASYRGLFNEMLDGFALHEIICDDAGQPVDYRFLSVNPAFTHMTGLQAQDIVGRTVREVLPDTERYWIETYGRVALTGEPAFLENYAAALNKHFEVKAYQPAPMQFACVITDITNRKQVELEIKSLNNNLEERIRQRTAELEQSTCRLYEAQRIAKLGNWRLDCSTNHVFWSEELYLMLGLDPKMTPPNYTEHQKLFTSESGERLSTAVARTHELGVPYDLELEMVRPNGSHGWMVARGEAVRGASGAIVALQGVAIDISERKHIEEALHQQTEALSRANADLETTNHLLIEAKIQAEAANIAKSAFLANMSHEIRTPMNGIVGMAGILRREGVSPQQAKRLDIIDASARHLLSVINDILDISKIEAGKFTLEQAPVVVSSLLSNVGSILAERAEAKGIRLLIETAHLPHNLIGDPTRLQQALLNYATNAVKFTEQGSVTLRAVLQDETDDSVRLRFEVQDTGIGITDEALNRLFGAFEQADNSMNRKYGGTGLGLAITRRLAELMGGEAGVDSAPEVGSTFWFTVKLKKGSKTNVIQAATTVNAEAEIRQRYAGQRILVVDDEPINAEITRLQLQAVNILVDTAEEGAAAVALVRKNRYAAIFMDMQMPTLNGLEATQQIRRLPGCLDIPIIAMTANAFAEDKVLCIEAGMNDFLIKPFVPDELFSTLLRALNQGGGLS